MVQAKKSLKQRLRMAAIITLAVLAVLTGGFFWYASDYYRAEDTALAVLAQEDGITVLDFKTDRVTKETVVSAANRYRPQLETYAEALSRIYEKNVKEKYLYFFHLGELIGL